MSKGYFFFLGVFCFMLGVFVSEGLDCEASPSSSPDFGRFEVVFEENQGVYVVEDEVTGLLYYLTYDKANSCINSLAPYNIMDETGVVRQAVKGVDYE